MTVQRRDFIYSLRIVGATGAIALAATLGACGHSHHTTATSSPSPSSTVTSSPAPSPTDSTGASPQPAPSAGSGTPTSPATPKSSPTPTKTKVTTSGFTSAQSQWKQGAKATSAHQGAYWAKAAHDLKAGKSTDKGDTSFYSSAIKDLDSLLALPDGQQTPTQQSEFQSDVRTLNNFFHTPGLYQ